MLKNYSERHSCKAGPKTTGPAGGGKQNELGIKTIIQDWSQNGAKNKTSSQSNTNPKLVSAILFELIIIDNVPPRKSWLPLRAAARSSGREFDSLSNSSRAFLPSSKSVSLLVSDVTGFGNCYPG
ncbi:hypothetical protein CEXT_267101 [Caerostris extrusa]|uniref:Uncharacterized protein n=1 Tax=Caerostris extrusa TaxID=172846 RepID=A0AAV4TFJ4_CAEEX|nr:hypothetical protein CEXT_267101 [Caerostris extrusa]